MDRQRPRLQEARQAAALTQQGLGELIGVAGPHIARWEAGSVMPRVDTALRLAAILGVTVEEIWPTPEDAPREPSRGGGMEGSINAATFARRARIDQYAFRRWLRGTGVYVGHGHEHSLPDPASDEGQRILEGFRAVSGAR